MQDYNSCKRDRRRIEKLKQSPMTESFLQRDTTQSANARLDLMLGKIQERLADIKKSKKSENDPPQLTSRSSPKREAGSPVTSSVVVNQCASNNSIDDFDELKQIQLGLIFKRSSLKANSEQKEYVRDFMNILSDDVSPSEHSKSQQLTQDTTSCKTPVRSDSSKATLRQDLKQAIKSQTKLVTEPDLKQRVTEAVSKTDAALKHYQRIQKARKSIAGNE